MNVKWAKKKLFIMNLNIKQRQILLTRVPLQLQIIVEPPITTFLVSFYFTIKNLTVLKKQSGFTAFEVRKL